MSQDFFEILETVKPAIEWKIALRGDTDKIEKVIYNQTKAGFFEQISQEVCKMKLRDLDQLELATPSTIASLTTALIEDSQRIIDEKLFVEHRRKGIGFLNGVFDLTTGKVRKYQSADFVCKPLPHRIPNEMDKEAEQYFLKVLKSWVGEEVGDWFLSVLAYVLFIFPNDEQIWLNLFGAGSNGKSVCLELLEKIVGDEKVIGCNLKDLNRFSGDAFQEKWLVIGRDSSSRVSDNATSFIKNFSGDEKFTVERKGGASYDTRNTGKIIVSTNSLIQSNDRTYSWYRRLFPIPFPNEFPRDPKFKEGILKRLPDLTRCLLHRAYLYRKNEITLFGSVPRQVIELMKETRMLNDRVTAFWEEYFFKALPGNDHDPQYEPDWSKIRFVHGKHMGEVYNLYADWHQSEFGDTDLEPKLTKFGGPYGAFLQTGAGKYYSYRKTNHGRVLELLPKYNEGGWTDHET
jgi:phage/plasmid-associated DNA primase